MRLRRQRFATFVCVGRRLRYRPVEQPPERGGVLGGMIGRGGVEPELCSTLPGPAEYQENDANEEQDGGDESILVPDEQGAQALTTRGTVGP